MRRWLVQWRKASGETKFFLFNWIIYSLLILATAIYSYARLDLVRSGPMSPKESRASRGE